MIGNYTSIYLNRLVMMGDYTIIYLIRLIMVGGSIGCGLSLPAVNYCYLLWFVCSIIAFYIPSARFFPFPFSLFIKIRKCNSHSSFFILHSSFKKSPVSGALPPDILPVFCYFHWLTSTKRRIMYIFRKNIPKSFGSSEKSSTFALAFRKTVLLKQINC